MADPRPTLGRGLPVPCGGLGFPISVALGSGSIGLGRRRQPLANIVRNQYVTRQARDRSAIWDRHNVHYVSTRGAAAASGFADVMLAGLARDGGLYVPDLGGGNWPQIEPKTIAAFAGRPYAEVAVEVMRPFVGDAAERRRSRPHGARGLWHVPPSRGRAAQRSSTSIPSRSNSFTGRRSPSKTWRCNCCRG